MHDVRDQGGGSDICYLVQAPGHEAVEALFGS